MERRELLRDVRGEHRIRREFDVAQEMLDTNLFRFFRNDGRRACVNVLRVSVPSCGDRRNVSNAYIHVSVSGVSVLDATHAHI